MIYLPVKSSPNSANPSGFNRYKIRKNNPLHFQHLQNSSDLFILKPLKPPLESTLTRPLSLTPLQSTLTKNRGRGVVLVPLIKNSRRTSMREQKTPGCTPFGSSSPKLKTVTCLLTTISSIARSAFVTPATGLPRATARRRWSPATACAITLPVVEHAVKQAPLPSHPDSAEAQSVSSPLSSSELRGEDASRYCPVCSQRLESRRCKLICNRCGYYMSCADYV